MKSDRSTRWLQPGRVAVIASHTFTQLVRMKVFAFLSVFALLIIVVNFFELPQFYGPESVGQGFGEGELRLLKSAAFGSMKLFSVVFAIAATALLLPRDVEDRTLYTILSKPVPRLDYLVGKLLGVIALIFVSLLAMDLLMTGVLAYRANNLLEAQTAIATARNWSADDIASMQAAIQQQGPTWSLQGGILAIFLQSAVIASVALLLSTFSTSSLFTIIVSFLVYALGHFVADAKELWKLDNRAGEGRASRVGTMLLLIFPNFQLFNITDAAIEGQQVSLSAIGQIAGVSVFYVILYTLLSWFVFSDKEF